MATRERAGLFDESSFAKFEVRGPGSPELLDSCAATTSTPGRLGHLHPDAERRGGIECDFTVTRLDSTASGS